MLKKLFLLFLLFCNIGFRLYAAHLIVLSTTDLHGNVTGRHHGMLRVAYLLEQQKKLYPADSVLLIDCGDTTQGTFSSMVFQGELMIKCLNYLKYDLWAVGNHDFDYGLPAIKKNMREFSGVSLAANLDSPYLAKVHSSWKMFTKAGIKVAVIGLTQPGMSKTVLSTDKAFRTISFGAALKRIMPEIRAAKPDVIILAQHQGMYAKGFSIYKFMAKYPEIDLVLGGHTHRDNPGQKIGPNTWYLQTRNRACGLGKNLIDYDKKQRKIIKINSEIIPVTLNTPIDKKLLEQIRSDLTRAEKLAKQKIATIIFKNTRKLDSSYPEQKIIGRMMLEHTRADVAICNAYPGKYKLAGTVPVTLQRLYYWSPYNNTICTLTLDKSTYQKVMAEQKSLLKKKYRTIISYASKDLFSNKSKILVAFSSYAVAGAGGKFPFLRKLAKNKKFMLKNTGIIIRDGLVRYLKGKTFIVSKEADGKISIEQKFREKVSATQ